LTVCVPAVPCGVYGGPTATLSPCVRPSRGHAVSWRLRRWHAMASRRRSEPARARRHARLSRWSVGPTSEIVCVRPGMAALLLLLLLLLFGCSMLACFAAVPLGAGRIHAALHRCASHAHLSARAAPASRGTGLAQAQAGQLHRLESATRKGALRFRRGRALRANARWRSDVVVCVAALGAEEERVGAAGSAACGAVRCGARCGARCGDGVWRRERARRERARDAGVRSDIWRSSSSSSV
jgi:hypothetical protein